MAPKRRHADQSSPSPPPPLRTPLSQRQPVVVFAHGTGAPSSSDWMVHWKEMMKDALDAVEVVTFDYPYMSSGKRRAPPKVEKLVDHHLGVVKDAVRSIRGTRLFAWENLWVRGSAAWWLAQMILMFLASYAWVIR